jgi:hypothetical protein
MWSGLLRLLFAVIPLIKLFTSWRERQRVKADAEAAAQAAIDKEEVKANREVAEILVERRPDSDASRRLRDGTL